MMTKVVPTVATPASTLSRRACAITVLSPPRTNASMVVVAPAVCAALRRKRITDHNPARPVIAQNSSHLAKAGDHVLDVARNIGFVAEASSPRTARAERSLRPCSAAGLAVALLAARVAEYTAHLIARDVLHAAILIAPLVRVRRVAAPDGRRDIFICAQSKIGRAGDAALDAPVCERDLRGVCP